MIGCADLEVLAPKGRILPPGGIKIILLNWRLRLPPGNFGIIKESTKMGGVVTAPVEVSDPDYQGEIG